MAWVIALSALAGCAPADGPSSAPAVDVLADAATDAATDAVTDAVTDATALDVPENPSADAGASMGDGHAPGGELVVPVRVTLDGVAVEGATVGQGGGATQRRTDAAGLAQLPLDATVRGALAVLASHPEARTQGVALDLEALPEVVEVPLERFANVDNPAYEYKPTGHPDLLLDEGTCKHCHSRIVETWWSSAHRTAAQNSRVHDLVLGTLSGFGNADACAEVGGSWEAVAVPGSAAPVVRCVGAPSVLASLNPGCAPNAPCEPLNTGECASCHAPAIPGPLGNRDLRDAREQAFETGVHCQSCHLVESVLPEGAPGVAGRLRLVRPSEEINHPVYGKYRPLSFGPHHDVATPVMGNVAREHFRDGSLCSGCHELHQEALVPGTAVDLARWPNGRFPVHTTYSEWKNGPFGGQAACASCHMPPLAQEGNSAGLQYADAHDADAGAGWLRNPGEVRSHAWVGPKSAGPGLGRLGLALEVQASTADGELFAEVTVRNLGAGHALPTGEPLRAVFVVVDAWCGDERATPLGGHVVDELGGSLEVRRADQDWQQWPAAQVGDVLRVVARPGGYLDYDGVPPFDAEGLPSFEKGIPLETLVAEVPFVDTAAGLALAAPLPQGFAVYRVPVVVAPGGPAAPLAGAPGRMYARVLLDGNGVRAAPHWQAVDVQSDHRLLPGAFDTFSHRFAVNCPEPRVRVSAISRSAPLWLAKERGWSVVDRLVAEVEQ
jgi:hypothetical protein